MFGWRLTNKKPEVESDIIKELHEKIDTEQRYRSEQARVLQKETDAAKKELHQVKKEEAERVKKAKRDNRKAAIAHLKMAERYHDAMTRAKGARRSELRAIVDKRLEQFTNLGFKLNGTITKTIEGLS